MSDDYKALAKKLKMDAKHGDEYGLAITTTATADLHEAANAIEQLSAEGGCKDKIIRAIEADIADAEYNCGRYNGDRRQHCAPYLDRKRICSDCPADWFENTREALATASTRQSHSENDHSESENAVQSGQEQCDHRNGSYYNGPSDSVRCVECHEVLL